MEKMLERLFCEGQTRFERREIIKFCEKIIECVVMSKAETIVATKTLENCSFVFLFDHLGVVPTQRMTL